MKIFETNAFRWGMLAALIVVAGVDYAHASASACYNISDSDARSYCLARAHREPGQCYNIKRADLRSMCLAEVQR